MNGFKLTKLALLLGAMGAGLFGSSVAQAGEYTGTTCAPVHGGAQWYATGTSGLLAGDNWLTVRCGVPMDETRNFLNFNFVVSVWGSDTTICYGAVQNQDGNIAWFSPDTYHSGSGFSEQTTPDGIAGTLSYSYSMTCDLAPWHALERIKLD